MRSKESFFIFEGFFFFQEEIHELLLSFAEAGATVVRLKGGDPLVSFWFKMLLDLASDCNVMSFIVEL